MTEIEKMKRPPEKYANMPNLWRVVCELAKFKDPYKAADMLLAVVSDGKGAGAA